MTNKLFDSASSRGTPPQGLVPFQTSFTRPAATAPSVVYDHWRLSLFQPAQYQHQRSIVARRVKISVCLLQADSHLSALSEAMRVGMRCRAYVRVPGALDPHGMTRGKSAALGCCRGCTTGLIGFLETCQESS